MGQDDGADIVNRYPILSGGFHIHIFAVVFGRPNNASPQCVGECRKTPAFVSHNAVVIARYDKALVNIHPAANWVNDFEHNTAH